MDAAVLERPPPVSLDCKEAIMVQDDKPRFRRVRYDTLPEICVYTLILVLSLMLSTYVQLWANEIIFDHFRRMREADQLPVMMLNAKEDPMIKAAMRTEAGFHLLLGITKENIDKLLQNDPIVFQLSELNCSAVELPDVPVVISWYGPQGCAVPKGFRESQTMLIVLDDDAIEALKTTTKRADNGQGFSLTLVYAATQGELEAAIAPFASPRTIVRRSGFAPSDIMPNQN